MSALVLAGFRAVDIDRAVIIARANADEHPLALPTVRYVGTGSVPGQVQVIEEVLVLLVPASRHRYRARIGQAVEPAFLLPDMLRIDLEVPDAGEVQLVTAVVLLRVKHAALLLPG